MKFVPRSKMSHNVAATILAVLAVATAGATSAYRSHAHEAAPKEVPFKRADAPKGHAKFGGVFEKLNLSAAQREAVDETNRKMFESARPIFSDATLSCDAKFAKMSELKEQHHAELKKILTPAQEAELKDLMASRFQRHDTKL